MCVGCVRCRMLVRLSFLFLFFSFFQTISTPKWIESGRAHTGTSFSPIQIDFKLIPIVCEANWMKWNQLNWLRQCGTVAVRHCGICVSNGKLHAQLFAWIIFYFVSGTHLTHFNFPNLWINWMKSVFFFIFISPYSRFGWPLLFVTFVCVRRLVEPSRGQSNICERKWRETVCGGRTKTHTIIVRNLEMGSSDSMAQMHEHLSNFSPIFFSLFVRFRFNEKHDVCELQRLERNPMIWLKRSHRIQLVYFGEIQKKE